MTGVTFRFPSISRSLACFSGEIGELTALVDLTALGVVLGDGISRLNTIFTLGFNI